MVQIQRRHLEGCWVSPRLAATRFEKLWTIRGNRDAAHAPHPIGDMNRSRDARSMRITRGPRRYAVSVPSAMRRRIVVWCKPVSLHACWIETVSGSGDDLGMP
jgi:hypothetical protein